MTDPREMGFRDTRRDGPARFLRELRELRSHAGLGHAELAARAHYPCDAIKAAEAGPGLPDLPVLSAYVRGCGGTVAEWEERWRAVTGSPASPLLTARGTGWSEAADAGARVGTGPFPADEQDSDRVIAALNRVADGMAASSAATSPSGAATSPSGAAASPAGSADIWTADVPAAADTDVWRPDAPVTGDTDAWTPAAPAAGDSDVWTPAARPAVNPDPWTPAAPPAGDSDPWTPAAPAAGDFDVWTPAAPAAGNMDVWTPFTRGAPGAVDGALSAAESVSVPGAADSIAAQAVPHTRRESDALTAGQAAGSGDRSKSADAGIHRPGTPAGMPPVATGQRARPHSPHASRTTLAVYALIALLVLVTLLVLFA